MENTNCKALPIGISDFRDIRSNDFCYVDKTYLIQRLIDSQARALLFTRPRRFGKSLALDMLRCFFDCNSQEENRPLFEGLAVSQSARYMSEQGKYPVISFNFKTATGNSREDIEVNMRNALRDALLPLDYLTQSGALSMRERSAVDQLLSSLVNDSSSPRNVIDNISTSLGFICSLLAKHHGQPTVILVDEYDAPLQAAYLNGFYKPVCDVMRNFFSSALKDNRHLRLGVITGVLRIAKESLFSGLNNLEVDTILSDDYADCFGFTQDEIDELAEAYGVTDKLEEISEWYDGYRFGELDIYNPWSVLQYFKNKCHPQAYWLETSSNDIVKAFLKRLVKSPGNPVVKLYQGGAVTASVDASVVYDQLSSADEDNNTLFSLMAVSGYLKPVERMRADRYKLVIPNRESKTIYSQEILSHLEEGLGMGSLAELGDAIVQGQVQTFTELLNRYMAASLSYYDTVEAFYHGWVMGLLLILDSDYYCLSNREAGEGRSDIMLMPRPGRANPGMVFELKRSLTVRQMAEKAAEALGQIEDKDYISAFPPQVTEVVGYGIAFCRKRCEVVQKVWRR